MIMITISFARNSLQNWFSSSIAITPCQALRKGDMLKISLLFYNSTISMCRYVIKCLPTILWFFSRKNKIENKFKKKNAHQIDLRFGETWAKSEKSLTCFSPAERASVEWVIQCFKHGKKIEIAENMTPDDDVTRMVVEFSQGNRRLYHRISLAISPVNRVLVGVP